MIFDGYIYIYSWDKAEKLWLLPMNTYSTRQNYGKKKRFNLQAPPVYDRKVTNLFFSIIIFSIIIFFSIILSVTVCPSIRNLNAF